MTVIFCGAILLVSHLALPHELDTPINELRMESYLWWNLQLADRSLLSSTSLENIARDNFFSKFQSLHRPTSSQFPEDSETLELRRLLATRGIPANLSGSEIELLRKDPQNFRFLTLSEIPFAGRFHGGGNFAERAKSNGLFFVIDFLKAYSNELRLRPSYRFQSYSGISRVNMDQAAKVLLDLYPNCEDLLRPKGSNP